jgi:hypothetical protein
MSVVEFVEGPDPLLAEVKKIRQLLETLATKPAVVTMQYPQYPPFPSVYATSTNPKGN